MYPTDDPIAGDVKPKDPQPEREHDPINVTPPKTDLEN